MNNNIFKKSIAILLSLTLLASLASCGNLHPANKAKREAVGIFESIKNQDIKKLNALFTEDVRDTHDLDEEWEEFFDSIDGDIVSYGSISSGGEGASYDYGIVTYSHVVIYINDVKTDTGMVYEYITYNVTCVDKKHPEREGVGLFSLKVPSDNDEGYEEVIVGEIITYYD